MYYPKIINKKLENGTNLEIRVKLIDGKFLIDDVGVKPKGKRIYKYIGGSSLTDDYSYRKLNQKDGRKMHLELILEVVPVEVLYQALEEVWLSLKPNKIIE
jgi:hypothetical protein